MFLYVYFQLNELKLNELKHVNFIFTYITPKTTAAKTNPKLLRDFGLWVWFSDTSGRARVVELSERPTTRVRKPNPYGSMSRTSAWKSNNI